MLRISNHTLQDASHTVGTEEMLLCQMRSSLPFTQHMLQKLMSTNKINVLSTKNLILITVAQKLVHCVFLNEDDLLLLSNM